MILAMKINYQQEDEARWQALVNRDAAWDGQFVYGVRSTGIYCRPGCPSRRPRRDQVVFFARPADAEKSGFRACKRCQPAAKRSPGAALVDQVRTLIDKAAADGQPVPNLASLSEQLSISPFHLQRTFRAVTGLTPRQYAAARRAEQIKLRLRNGESVTQALHAAGYSSASRLYEDAAAAFGMTPGTYRRGGAGMQITYTLIELSPPLSGWLVLASTARGICAVQFGDSALEAETALAQEFPRADLRRDDASLHEWANALRCYLADSRAVAALPLDVQGTEFQQRVWAELRRIPIGETRSYTQVAEALQQPAAVRAVARACATNPAALIIPCHRVVRSDGSLAGYRWGLARKRTLLDCEKREALKTNPA